MIAENTIARRAIATDAHPGTLAGGRSGYMLKRALDVLCALLLLLLLCSWLFPFISLLILLDSRGPVFFLQERNGMHNRVFRCIKFRTMVPNEQADKQAAHAGDPRITRLGKVLRTSGIDELPQLLNVLAGHMSLVGPRPHMIQDNLLFEKMGGQYQFRHRVKPGITGLAQVRGYKGNARNEQDIRMRVAVDLLYIKKQSLSLDIKIMCATAKMMFAELFKRGGRK